jgi:hypothetical protein
MNLVDFLSGESEPWFGEIRSTLGAINPVLALKRRKSFSEPQSSSD